MRIASAASRPRNDKAFAALPRNDRRSSGFTLVEIVVVLVILGVSAAVVVPALRIITPADGVSVAAGEVAGVLRTARRTALERAMPVVVTITPGSGQYIVEGIEHADSVTSLASGAFSVGTGVTLGTSGPRMRVAFDRYGLAQADSLTVRGDEGSAVVGVERWSGDVYVRPAGR